MPQIIKSKTKNKVSVSKKALPQRSKTLSPQKKSLKTKPKKSTALKVALTPKPTRIKSSPIDYYNCLLTYANQGWHSSLTGEKKKITACCKDCKANAPALNHQRDKELVKLISSYKQVGESLAKLLKPLS